MSMDDLQPLKNQNQQRMFGFDNVINNKD